MLTALISGQRAQTIAAMNSHYLRITTECVCFDIVAKLKTNKPVTIHFPRYHEAKLCAWSCFMAYWFRTLPFRGGEKYHGELFLTINSPHGVAAKDTIKNWVKTFMSEAGVDVSKYKVHSTRAASTSKAANSLPLSSILKAAGWATGSTFAAHYHRPVVEHSAFAEAVLLPTRVQHR